MRSYQIKGDVNLEAFDSYLKNSYPVEIISSAKNFLKLKIYGFYRLLPMQPFIFETAIVSINYDENSDCSTVKFSFFSSHFIAWFLASLLVSVFIAGACTPDNYFEFFVSCIIFFLLIFLPDFFWAWFKHGRIISILSNNKKDKL